MSTLIEDAEDVRAMEQKAVKERPILFSGAMVRAILSGQKTQTRRVVKPEIVEHFNFMGGDPDDNPATPDSITLHWGEPIEDDDTKGPAQWLVSSTDYPEEGCIPIGAAYGQPGDRLWVREAWNQFDGWQGYFYRADDNSAGVGEFDDPDHIPEHALKWRPSIHMPRSACRIVLEIVSVRVERLQEISDDDCEAEGIDCHSLPTGGDDYHAYWRDYSRTEKEADGWPYFADGQQRESFRTLWESINGPESWNANPWVWVVEFKRVAA